MGVAFEKYASRKATDSENPSAEAVWMVVDEANESAAWAAFAGASVPSTYTFPSGRVAVLSSVNIVDVSDTAWEFVVAYSSNPPKAADTSEFEFNISLQDVTVTQAIATTPYTAGGRTAPDVQKGVNISADGKVQGVGVGLPTFSFSITKYWALADVPASYLIAIKGLAGKYNNALFQPDPLPSPFAAGTIRFVGSQGKPVGSKFPINYRFEFQENSTETVGDITGITKLGWQYLDIYRRVITDEDAKKKIEVPHSVFVHTLPPGPGDFSILGLS